MVLVGFSFTCPSSRVSRSLFWKFRGCRDSRMTLSSTWPVLSDNEGQGRLNSFLRRSRARIIDNISSSSGRPHAFMGNEAADLDSFVSSIVLAYCSELNGNAATAVINCPRADVNLRGDVSSVISVTGIEMEQLVFMDEVQNLEQNVAAITLLDHNELATHQKFLSSKVVSIIDHHDDTGAFKDASLRIIAPCGSCSTLVFERCRVIASEEMGNRTIAAMLLSAILIDTHNMDDSAGRGTPRDAAAIRALTSYTGMNEDDRTAMFDSLSSSKQEQGHLSTRDLLRRDYKQFETAGHVVGISSVGICLYAWTSRAMGEAFKLSTTTMQQFCVERNIDVLLIMTSFMSTAGVFCRELVICPRSLDCSHFALFLSLALQEARAGLELEPNPLQVCLGTVAKAYIQKNIKASRKQVAPLVLRSINERAHSLSQSDYSKS